MSDVAEAVRKYLLTNSSVSAIIGQRMYHDAVRQGATLPACTIHKASESHDHLLSDRSGFVQTRLQIECFSLSRALSNAIAEAIYKSGVATLKGVASAVNIRGVTVEDGQRNYLIYDSDGGDDHTYVTQFDLLVSYLE